ncbi:Rieske 2Fe-2S domain-containing protein [Rathayibacter sp. VKM Ac-2759]|uniref:Rieske 2Fe-2S domain-containing protein n=1 Tax=Rathayibacter sp. VKM Ac-2759 TaxID=2609252 RepID=UPI001315F069|nr:Rieske 2Fe-2S domain-containing protein [Rathayibacter sp. VKM Ac-2759]QHC68625.1 Rieske 2Fe-2S domain-containing protein [Rathayibacter sp. VKM Ac-2759]
MREMKFVKLVTRLEDAAALDPLVGRVRTVVNRVIRPQPVRDVLHGVPVGHPVHPLLVLIPAGAWLSAAVLDLLPGNERASRALIGVGVVSVLPTAAAGYTDWSELHEQQMRVGLVHAGANVIATALYAASFVQRGRGHRVSGKVLSMVGLAVVSGGGYLGGHLSYRQAAGVNHAEDVPHRFPTGWQLVGPLEDLPERKSVKKDVAGMPLLVFRRGDRVNVLSNVCSHLSGPLDDGEVTEEGGEACVACPWHSSVFSLETGEVLRGPATSPQPRFETRITEGRVEVLLPNAG